MEAGRILIVKVDEAALLIGDLFRKTFAQEPPRIPVHYVAFYQLGPSTFEAIGYNHATHCAEYILTGGLCVDPRYRNMGVADRLQRIIFEEPGDKKAFFGYAGNLHLALRVGYLETPRKNLVVKWIEPLADAEKERLFAEVNILEPF
jgi:GNAT superfamily N-acetyltransferase